MALEKSRFFDSVGDDRTYQAEHFAEYFRLFLTDGIKNGGTNLKVSATGTGMNIKVDYGVALVRGYGYWLTNDGGGVKQYALGAADTLARIDRVILRLDRSLSERQITIQVKKGTPAANPVPPTLTRTENTYELSLAQVRVRANSVKLEASDITDERYDPDVCGLINSLIELDGSVFEAEATAILEQLATQGYLPATGKAVDSDKLDGLDSTDFARSSHNHDASYLGKTATATDSSKLGGKLPSAYAASSHTHTIANVTNLQTTLDGKAASSHTHTIANVSNLQTTLNGKAASSHTHTIANVTDLQTTLNGKAHIVRYGSSVPSSLLAGQIFVKI